MVKWILWIFFSPHKIHHVKICKINFLKHNIHQNYFILPFKTHYLLVNQMHCTAYKTFASKQSMHFALKRSVNVTPRLISIANFWWRYCMWLLWASLFISLCMHSKDKPINREVKISTPLLSLTLLNKHFMTANVMKPVSNMPG